MNKEAVAILLLPLLAVAIASTATVSSTEAPSAVLELAPASAPEPNTIFEDENLALIIPTEMISLNFGSCISVLFQTEGCVTDTALLFLHMKFKISPKCCAAIDGGGQCLGNPLFSDIFKSLCALAT